MKPQASTRRAVRQARVGARAGRVYLRDVTKKSRRRVLLLISRAYTATIHRFCVDLKRHTKQSTPDLRISIAYISLSPSILGLPYRVVRSPLGTTVSDWILIVEVFSHCRAGFGCVLSSAELHRVCEVGYYGLSLPAADGVVFGFGIGAGKSGGKAYSSIVSLSLRPPIIVIMRFSSNPMLIK